MKQIQQKRFTEYISDKKYRLAVRLIIIIIYSFINLEVFAGVQATFYVSPGGSDNNPGTLALPFATIEKARDVARTINSNMSGDIIIYLREGVYNLMSTFTLTGCDSGYNTYSIIYQAYKCEKPIISGGMRISGWVLADPVKNIYKATIGILIDTRQLYVNGKRAIRARSDNASGWFESGDGYTCPAEVSTWHNLTNIEVVAHKEWKSHRGPIASVTGTHAVMAQPYWNLVHNQYDAPPVWIENAYELLDSEGEWYLDKSTGSLYYKPRQGEDMANAEVIFPNLEALVKGSNVHNVHFKGITFSYATWLRPNSSNGYPCLQADCLYSFGQIPGNIAFDHSENLVFENNTFCHLGITGLQLFLGCNQNLVYNNVFNDISGSAISIGGITNANPSFDDVVKDNMIVNNLITNIASEYEGCVGVFVGYSEHTTISHNEIRRLPYSGISAGWGWKNTTISGKNNEISYNRIDSIVMALRDAGGVYTLSSQPGAHVHDNYISHQFNEFGSLYPDEGSSNMHWHHNVVSNVVRWLHMWTSSIQNDTVDFNYYDNQTQTLRGTNCVVQNNVFVPDGNWPPEAQKIMNSAGRKALSIELTGVPLVQKYYSLNVNDIINLTYSTISQCDSINRNISWVSGDTLVATVSSTGLVKAKAPGIAKITLTTQYASEKDSLEVIVNQLKGILDNPVVFNFIYPNPATVFLTIKNLRSSNATIMIFDLQGKQVLKKQLSSGQLDISNLSRGFYIVKLVDSGIIYIDKLVKE